MLKLSVVKTYQSKKRKVEIRCNADVIEGSTTAIYGKSGVGKSTVLRMIAGLDSPDEGLIKFGDHIWFNGDKNEKIARRSVGFVFQDFNLFEHMTIERNLTYASGGQIPDDILEILPNLGLKQLLKSYPKTLSGGEQQRAAIVRALCQKPRLLLLDEPFSALDDDSIAEVIAAIKIIQKSMGTTVMVVSHRKDVIQAMADYVIHLKAGTTGLVGKPSLILPAGFNIS